MLPEEILPDSRQQAEPVLRIMIGNVRGYRPFVVRPYGHTAHLRFSTEHCHVRMNPSMACMAALAQVGEKTGLAGQVRLFRYRSGYTP